MTVTLLRQARGRWWANLYQKLIGGHHTYLVWSMYSLVYLLLHVMQHDFWAPKYVKRPPYETSLTFRWFVMALCNLVYLIVCTKHIYTSYYSPFSWSVTNCTRSSGFNHPRVFFWRKDRIPCDISPSSPYNQYEVPQHRTLPLAMITEETKFHYSDIGQVTSNSESL